jgi:hypothetical protein
MYFNIIVQEFLAYNVTLCPGQVHNNLSSNKSRSFVAVYESRMLLNFQ